MSCPPCPTRWCATSGDRREIATTIMDASNRIGEVATSNTAARNRSATLTAFQVIARSLNNGNLRAIYPVSADSTS